MFISNAVALANTARTGQWDLRWIHPMLDFMILRPANTLSELHVYVSALLKSGTGIVEKTNVLW